MKRSTASNEKAHSDAMVVMDGVLDVTKEMVKRRTSAASEKTLESTPKSDKGLGCVAMEGSLISKACRIGVDKRLCLTAGEGGEDRSCLMRGTDLPPASSLSFLQPRARSVALHGSRPRESVTCSVEHSSRSESSTANMDCDNGRSLLSDSSINRKRRVHATDGPLPSTEAGRDKDSSSCESPSTPLAHEDGTATQTPDSMVYSERQSMLITSPATDFSKCIQSLSMRSPVQRLPPSTSGSPYTPSFKSSFSPYSNRATANANASTGLPKLHALPFNPSPRHVSVTVLSHIDVNQAPIQPSPRKVRGMILTSPAGTPRRHNSATVQSPSQKPNLTPKRRTLISPQSSKKGHLSPRTPLPKLTLSPRISPQFQSLLFQSPGADYVPMYSCKEDVEGYLRKAGPSLNSTMDMLQQPNLAFPLAEIQCSNKKKRSPPPPIYRKENTGKSFRGPHLALLDPSIPKEKTGAELSQNVVTDFVLDNESSHACIHADDAKNKLSAVGFEMDAVPKCSSHEHVAVSKGEMLPHDRSQAPHAAFRNLTTPVAMDSWLHLKPDKRSGRGMRRHSLTFSDDGSTSSLSSMDDEDNEKPRCRRSSIHRHHRHDLKRGALVSKVPLQRKSRTSLGVETRAPSALSNDRFASTILAQSIKTNELVSSSRTAKTSNALLEHDTSEHSQDEALASDFEDDVYENDVFFLNAPFPVAKHQPSHAMSSRETLNFPMESPEQDCINTGSSLQQNSCCFKDTDGINATALDYSFSSLTSLQSIESHSGSFVHARRSRQEHQRRSSDTSEGSLIDDGGNPFDRRLSSVSATLFGMDIIHENAAIEVSLPTEMPMHTPKGRRKSSSDVHLFLHRRVTSENSLSSLSFAAEDTPLCSDGLSSRDLITPPVVRQIMRSPPPIHQTNLSYLLAQDS